MTVFALGLKAAGNDSKRFLDVVDPQLSRWGITRKDITKCDPDGYLLLRKSEECAKTNDRECIITQQDIDEADKARTKLNNSGALLTAYKRYAHVKYRNETRQGYMEVYVNDIELDRARTAVKAIEDNAVAEDKIWIPTRYGNRRFRKITACTSTGINVSSVCMSCSSNTTASVLKGA
jgi:hypothetical protein